MRLLGLKTCLFSSELEGYVFPGTEYGSECMNSFVVLSPNWNKKERPICEFEMGFKKSFCWRSNLSNYIIISTYARSENGHGSKFGLRQYCQDL